MKKRLTVRCPMRDIAKACGCKVRKVYDDSIKGILNKKDLRSVAFYIVCNLIKNKMLSVDDTKSA